MDRYGFLAGFHFKVEFLNLGGNDVDTRFQSVAGLSVNVETDSVREGGENRFEHVLPNRTAYSDLVLKRGLVTSSEVISWCLDTFSSLEIHPVDVNVSLLNDAHEPAMTWQIKGAWPKKWEVSDLDAETSAIVIETLELGYRFFTVA